MILSGLDERESGYISGFFCGDGYKYHDKKQRHYTVEFFVDSKDSDLIEKISQLLRKASLKSSRRSDKRFNCVRIRTRSKRFFNELSKSPPELKSAEFAVGFISGLIDAEGYVNPKKRMIQIVNTDEDLLKTSTKALKILGIESRITQKSRAVKDRQRAYSLYVPVSFTKLNNLSTKVSRL